jgi:hypothetical protein
MTTKPDMSGPRRWRFSLKSLLVAVAFLSVFLAITITGGRTKEMGQTGIHARHYGWPVAYLRVPTGEYADKVPADVFVPGLLVDLIVAAGRIEVTASKETLAKLPVMALTDNGAVETDGDDAMFDSVNFTTGAAADGSRRNWRGIKSKESADSDRFSYFERPARVLGGTENEPSLTLISRSGSVSLMVNE